MGHHIWTDGNPLVYTEWYSPKMLRFVDKAFLDIVLPKLILPLLQVASPCTAMIPLPHPRWTNWVKVPCNFQPSADIGVGYICKKHLPTTTQKPSILDISAWIENRDDRHTLVQPDRYCTADSTHFENYCFKFYAGLEATWAEANALCSQRDAFSLWKYNDSIHYRKLFKLWNFSKQENSIWINERYLNQGQLHGNSCSVMNLVESNKDDKLKIEFIDCRKVLSTVICEAPPLARTSKCTAKQFTCPDGTCISYFSVCDGKEDCLNGTDEANDTCLHMTFQCNSGQIIPLSRYCDYVQDCADNSDEICEYPKCQPNEFQCANQECVALRSRCNFIEDCQDGSDENQTTCNWRLKCNKYGGFLCISGKCLPKELQNDNFQDCHGRFQEDELHHSLTAVSVTTKRCDTPNNTFNCGVDDNECIKVDLVCVHDYDIRGAAIGCSNFAHLLNCKDFECPNMFKCPNSYCIPVKHVCDGTYDCVNGWDERYCNNFSCPGLFRCDDEISCIEQQLVCDGTSHCKHGDDEMFCDFITCPKGCLCKGYVLNCSLKYLDELPQITHQARSIHFQKKQLELTVTTFMGYHSIGYLDLSSNNLTSLPPSTFSNQSNLFSLNISNNHITYLESYSFWGLVNLKTLDISSNPLQVVQPSAFMGLNSISVLDLSKLAIVQLKANSFKGLPKVHTLSLKGNKIKSIESGSFKGLLQLRVLYLENNEITDMPLDTFKPLNQLERIHTDAFKFCCLAGKKANCTPTPDEFSSCNDLMANPTLQISIWILGIVAILGNVFVIIWRCCFDASSITSLLVLNLALSDLLMGIYLIIIASVDTLYRGGYILFDEEWRSSFGCKLAGALSAISSEVSVFTLLVITIDRTLVIVFPFKSKLWRLGTKGIKITCIAIWAIWLAVFVVTVFENNYFRDFYGGNGVCLPFTLKNTKNQGWEFSLSVFVLMNFLVFLVIAIGYWSIFYSVRATRRKSQRNDDEKREVRLAVNSTLIIFTDFFCWMPIILLSVLALNGVSIPPEVSAWVAVFVLPLNSAINPLLYTPLNISRNKKKLHSAS